ncbi:PAS domain-containing hybrid sensor histidine kinase/response regulator [Azospirillum doebereinerae]
MTQELPGGLRRRAESVLGEGRFSGTEPNADSLKEIVHELYVHQAELEIQNEELRVAQQALEASRLQYVQMFQSLPLACVTVNAAGIVGEANPAAERQFGLPLRRLKGRPLTLLVESMDHGRLFTALARLRNGGSWTRQEYRYTGPHGVIDGLTDARIIATAGAPLGGDDAGDVLLTLTDVTERNVWLHEVQRARDDAEQAQAAYHHILQAVADGLFGLDEDGRIRFVNAAALTMTGFAETELIGHTLPDLLADSGPDSPATQAFALAMADGQPRTVPAVPMHRRDGRQFLAEMTVSPIHAQRRGEGAVVAVRDVTARRAAEEALSLSERRHRILVQSLHEGLVMRSVDGPVHIANPMAERLMAGPAAVLLDPRARSLDEGRLSGGQRRGGPGPRFVDTDGARLDGQPPAAQAATSGRPVIERIVGIAEDDAAASPLRWLRVSSLPVAAPDGRVESVVSSVTDITVMKALERELSVALDAKERFMASASHDLRQPVQALMLLSGLLLREPLDEGARKLADQLRVSVGSLGTLLDCMLDISKLEAGLVSPEPAPVDLAALMERLHGDFLPVAAASGLRLTTVPARCILRTDEALLERVLRNLLANALRYTPQGRVLFGVRRFQGGIRLEVRDTGIGIAETQIDRIFQDFYQVGNAARDRREGLGMGLSIAKRLVAMLGGAIHVTSEFGRGSCFAVSLPVEEVVEGSRAGGKGAPEAAPAIDDALVLLVEDDAVIRMALGMMLEGWGYRILEAGTASEATGHLDDGAVPDLVLTDYRLPDSATGLMVMDTVRRRLARDVPGVLLTGDTSPERLHEAVNAQCALLHKPIQPFALRDTVRAALRGAGAAAAPS